MLYWATPVQSRFLYTHLPGFIEAILKLFLKKWFLTTFDLWFSEFPETKTKRYLFRRVSANALLNETQLTQGPIQCIRTWYYTQLEEFPHYSCSRLLGDAITNITPTALSVPPVQPSSNFYSVSSSDSSLDSPFGLSSPVESPADSSLKVFSPTVPLSEVTATLEYESKFCITDKEIDTSVYDTCLEVEPDFSIGDSNFCTQSVTHSNLYPHSTPYDNEFIFTLIPPENKATPENILIPTFLYSGVPPDYNSPFDLEDILGLNA